MAGTLPNLHTMVPRRSCIQGVLKVKVEVKGHVIWAHLWYHEMFATQYGLTFCFYMRSLYEYECSEILCNVKWNVYLAMEIPDCVSFISGQNSDDRVRSCEPNEFLA